MPRTHPDYGFILEDSECELSRDDNTSEWHRVCSCDPHTHTCMKDAHTCIYDNTRRRRKERVQTNRKNKWRMINNANAKNVYSPKEPVLNVQRRNGN